MTPKQKIWLDEHAPYEPVGVIGGLMMFTSRGILHPDGRFVVGGKVPPLDAVKGAFLVGIRGVREPGTMADPRAAGDIGRPPPIRGSKM